MFSEFMQLIGLIRLSESEFKNFQN